MRKQITALVFLAGSMFFSAPAFSCSCAQNAFSPEGSKSNINNAALIFKGAVKSVQAPPVEGDGSGPSQNKNFSKVSLAVQELYKGESAGDVEAYFDTMTSCGTQVKEGESGLYILSAYDGVFVSADLCGKYIAPEDMKILKSGGFLKAVQAETKKEKEAPPAKVAEEKKEDGATEVPPEEIKPDPFKEEFESEESLKSWARESTWGGGYTEKRSLMGEDLMLVFRSYTSGVPSFDAGVYKRVDLKWILVKSHPPVLNDQPMVQIIDENLVIMSITGGAEILSVSRFDLF
ncbi:MAG TPA: hypothetical protein DEA55_09730 [Rhodospirillaceae bacterium]|nr:hypothetical protein [Rhodospirillaceae bacterium]